MLTQDDLEQIEKLIASSEQRLTDKIEATRQELKQAIQDAQEDTLNAMSDLVHEVYNMHEKRIRNIEHHVGLTSTH